MDKHESGFSNDCRKTDTKVAKSATNQSQFLAITCNMPMTRENRVCKVRGSDFLVLLLLCFSLVEKQTRDFKANHQGGGHCRGGGGPEYRNTAKKINGHRGTARKVDETP